MKYFRFVCDIKTKPTEVVNTTRDRIINEVGIYCAYLSRMYEYYFPATQTDNVVSITVCLIEDTQEMTYPQSCTNMKVVSTVIDIEKFSRLPPNDKSLYIIELCQQSIMLIVSEMHWNTAAFERSFNKIVSQNCLFREHWRKAKNSPSRQLKAQIYFEDDYEKDGVYVDFTDNKGQLLNRIQFAPKGYQIYCRDIGEIHWTNDQRIIVPKTVGHSFSEKICEYWIIGVNGDVDFHFSRAEGSEANPHGLYDLGILYWEGRTILQNKDKGLKLIKKAAELNYKHAQKWLERNIKQLAAEKKNK